MDHTHHPSSPLWPLHGQLCPQMLRRRRHGRCQSQFRFSGRKHRGSPDRATHDLSQTTKVVTWHEPWSFLRGCQQPTQIQRFPRPWACLPQQRSWMGLMLCVPRLLRRRLGIKRKVGMPILCLAGGAAITRITVWRVRVLLTFQVGLKMKMVRSRSQGLGERGASLRQNRSYG